jgi:membrane dipeptidase
VIHKYTFNKQGIVMFCVDGHLDIAHNVLSSGRDVTLTLEELRACETPEQIDRDGVATVCLPALQAGGVGLVFATIFVEPHREGRPNLSRHIYYNAEEAHTQGVAQIGVYRSLAAQVPEVRLVGTQRDLTAVEQSFARGERPVGLVFLMEGADPIREPAEVGWWVKQGVRLIGPAWSATRYAGGTYKAGPVTEAGFALLREMAAYNVVLDTSHLSEEAFWQAVEAYEGAVIASHSNPRTFVPGVRQLSDEQIKAIVSRDGIVGIVLYNAFLNATWRERKLKADVPLDMLANAIDHVCQLAGDTAHTAIGSDMDGGLGRDEIPMGLDSSADFPRIADPLAARGYSDSDIAAILGGNWLRLLRQVLPA